jgi:hypothetical protein
VRLDFIKEKISKLFMNKLIVFEDKKIRRILHNDEWYFSVVDIVGVLTSSSDYLKSRKYWNKLKQRLKEEGSETVTNCHQLKLKAQDGKLRLTDCANTKSIFRIIQSIPSKKAEPFKMWLAQVGHERIEEIENPELGQDRIKEYYELKGYPKGWIDKRLRGIAIRQDLTDEWKNRGATKPVDFAILTNEISKATFGMTIGEYKKFKGLEKPCSTNSSNFLAPTSRNQNLRDHMGDWELILNMIGEKATTDITISKDSKGLKKLKIDAKDGGDIAKNTRTQLEKKIGKSLISKENNLHLKKKSSKHLNK